MQPSGTIDIHDRKGKLNSARRILRESTISKRNNRLIRDFVEYKIRADNIGVLRQVKYLRLLKVLAEKLDKDFDKATKRDIEKLQSKICSMDVKYGKRKGKLSTSSKYDYMIILKTFFRWLKKKKEPEEVEWINPLRPKTKKLHPDKILTWEDVILLSKASMNPRDKALVQVLWDTGGRIEEILTLQLTDIETVIEGQAVKLHFRKSKIEESLRSPLIVRSAPALLDWIRYHPLRNDKTAPLFIKLNVNKPMNYDSARKVLKDLKERSGLDKPVNPHNFRKSSASFYSHVPELSELEVKTRFGWKKSSKMLDIYCNVSEKKVNDKILELHGLKDMDKTREEIKPVVCICGTTNPAGEEYCVLCKRPLTLKPEEIIAHGDIKAKIKQTLWEILGEDTSLMNKVIEKMNES